MTNSLLKYFIHRFSIILFFINIFISCSYTPNRSAEINKSVKIFKTNTELDNRGKCITSVGELRTLIVYICFSDDSNTVSDSWKFSNTDLPEWGAKMINNSTVLEFPIMNLTQYFYEMSKGNLMLFGDVYPKLVVPEHNQQYYKSISDVNYEVLKKLDEDIDFSKYDNWSKDKDGKYINRPDGQVDVIFLVYRNFGNRLYFNNDWTGIAHLYLTENIDTYDGVIIATGRLDKGSGIQSRGGKAGFTYMKYVLAHEFGHFLFGNGHIENVTNLALMTGGPVWNASRGMHSWERNQLAWINLIDIPVNQNSMIEMDDYMSAGEAYRIKLNAKEWFILENHQKMSGNDWAQAKGVYIYKVDKADNFAPSITVECADGNWNFEIDKNTEKLIKTIPNPLGKSEMNFSKIINKKSYACYDQVYGNNSAWGDEFDAFNLAYNNLFSPVSNPSSMNNSQIDFAIEVMESKENKFLVNIYFNDIYKNTPPSKPQLIGIDQESSNKVMLKWLINKEPDLSGYIIYTSQDNSKNYEKYIKINANHDSNSAEFNLFPILKATEVKYVIYLKAFDNSGMESVRSDLMELTYSSINERWRWQRFNKL